MKHIANIITTCRILGSILLLFFPAFSSEFYIIYLLCGFSDMIDGPVARKTHSNGEWGSKLDSVADIFFVMASLLKLLPSMCIPRWLWIWFGVIAAVKIFNIVFGYVSEKQFVFLHTIMNKVIGLLLFLMPLTIPFAGFKYNSVVVCSVATLSAIQEGFYIVKDIKPKFSNSDLSKK